LYAVHMNQATEFHTPGRRVQHSNGKVGTVLLVEWDWPTYLDPADWSYVRFDDGIHNYFPNSTLRPRRGLEGF
jgi:hypothetical protein